MKAAFDILRDEMLRAGVRKDDITEYDSTLHVRYFGDWQVPADEEDDGDYDWKEPTPSTRRALDRLVAEVSKKVNAKIVWQNEGEKCWVSFYAEGK